MNAGHTKHTKCQQKAFCIELTQKRTKVLKGALVK